MGLPPLAGVGWDLGTVFRWCRYAQPPAIVWQASGLCRNGRNGKNRGRNLRAVQTLREGGRLA